VRAKLRLMLPLSAKAVQDDFDLMFKTCVAETLAISAARIQNLKYQQGSTVVEFEIAPGLSHERGPEEALREFAVQLAKPNNFIPRELAWYIAGATLEWPSVMASTDTLIGSIVLPMHEGARNLLRNLSDQLSSNMISSSHVAACLTAAAQKISARRPDLWCVLRDPLTPVEVVDLMNKDSEGSMIAQAAWEQLNLIASAESAVAALWSLTRPSIAKARRRGIQSYALSVDEEVLRSAVRLQRREMPAIEMELSDAQKQFFEVMCASDVDLAVAFRVLDRNGDGLVSLRDFLSMIQELQLPLSDADVCLAAQAIARGKCIDIAEFAMQYRAWLDARLMRSPRLASSMPRVPLPSTQVIEFLPPRSLGSECIKLPSFVVFAFLDVECKGQVSELAMQRFSDECLGFSSTSAANMCDLIGRGIVTYREFRKYYDHVDRRLCARRTPEEMEELGIFRAKVRGVLEIANQPEGPRNDVDRERRRAQQVIEDALKCRGRCLDGIADAAGLSELFSDLRVPADVAPILLRWHSHLATIGSQSVQASPSYSSMLASLRHAHHLLKGHLDTLFGAILLSTIDLNSTFDAYLRQPGQRITLQELEEVLRKAVVDISAVDLQDVVRVLDPNQRGSVWVPELIVNYDSFRKRYGGILGTLADNLTRLGLSADELFARAAHMPIGLTTCP